MNYSKILSADIANGDGFRVSLWVSGCNRHCKGCFNPEAWDCNYGKPFTDREKRLIFAELNNEWCRGISLLGGDPLSHLSDNRKVIIELTREIKEKYPEKTIYLWTGYMFDEIKNDDSMKEILNYVDILIDGPFIEEEKDTTLFLKGSKNQRAIDLREYRKSGELKEVY